MKKVTLYNLYGVAAVVPMKTGVIHTNQIGGGACLHPELEGILVPFNDDYEPEDYKLSLEYQLMEMFAENGWGTIMPKQADEIDALLKTFPDTNCAVVNRAKLEESHESWVWCNVTESEHSCLEGFGNVEVVLTWCNSD